MCNPAAEGKTRDIERPPRVPGTDPAQDGLDALTDLLALLGIGGVTLRDQAISVGPLRPKEAPTIADTLLNGINSRHRMTTPDGVLWSMRRSAVVTVAVPGRGLVTVQDVASGDYWPAAIQDLRPATLREIRTATGSGS